MGRVSNAKQRLMGAVAELIWTGSYGSTTIDQICEKAGVKKGSFYYFFDSKADLAVAALDAEAEKKRPELDAQFSPTIPPLERLRKHCQFACRHQAELKGQYGFVLGCPLFTLGAEVSTQETRLRAKIEEMLGSFLKYIESAIRDAHAGGLIHAPDANLTARMLLAYYEGILTQARIQNRLEVLQDMERGTFAMLGVKNREAVAA